MRRYNKTVPDYDAVIVPGGGVRAGGALPPWVKARLEKALEIADGAYIIALSAGTAHKAPPLDARGRPIYESQAGAHYLLQRGYPRDRVLVEAASYDTIGNAWFCRVVHTDPAGFRRLAVVTSGFHKPRTEAIFRWVFSLDAPQPAYLLDYIATPDTGMPPEVLASRRARERESLDKAAALARRIATMRQLHHWLFTAHEAYAAAGSPADRAGEAALESY
jgi:hypothetical protein